MESISTTMESMINDTNCSLYGVNDSALSTNCSQIVCQTYSIDLMHGINILLYACVCVVGLCGNALVIYVVLRYSKMQTVTNMYILNLAVADELFLIGVPLLLATMTVGYWPFGNSMCKVYMTTTSINQFSSSVFLTVMSTDRYIAVCHPISSPRYRTPFISKVVCLTGWMVSALMMVPIFMYANQFEDFCQNTCNILWPESQHMNGQTAFTLYTFILGFAIPLLLIFVFYSLVIRKLKRVGPRNKSKEKKKSHRKVTKLVLTVITVYVGCWLPYWIGQVALIFTEPKLEQATWTVVFYLLIGCLSYSNSAVNPILYAFLSDNFKKSFLKACQCATRKEVNSQLHMENSVFPRKNRPGSEKNKPRCNRGGESNLNLNDQEQSTAITQVCKSNNLHLQEKDPMLLNNDTNGENQPKPTQV